MLKYHFTLEDETKRVEFDAGRTSNWKALDYGEALPQTSSRNAKLDVAWVYFAAEQAGKLEELGIPEDCTVDEAIVYIADNFDVINIDDNTKDKAPLANAPAK